MNKIPTIEETLDEVEKHWDTDRTEATRAIMRYASGQRTALLTELRDSGLLEEVKPNEQGGGFISSDDKYTVYQKGNNHGHNTLARSIKAHLDELINRTH